MFILTDNIQINKVRFSGVSQVKVKRSIGDISATATLKFPLKAIDKSSSGDLRKINTSTKINVGDPIEINLGYNGDNKTEFIGFIIKKNDDNRQLTIECEDYAYKLRNASIDKTYAEGENLSQVLQDITSNVFIDALNTKPLKLAPGCTDMVINKLVLADTSGEPISRMKALNKVLDTYLLSAHFTIDGQLYVGLHYTDTDGSARYKTDYNIIDTKNLKVKSKEDNKVLIKAVSTLKNGEKIIEKAGKEGGDVKTYNFANIDDKEKLKELAESKLKEMHYEGYEGKMKTFLIPYVLPGMAADLIHDSDSDRSGKYFIESVETTYGLNGGRRNVELSIKLDD
ncbi:MAG: hypothetical protein MI922_28145 [Bacteroidales bacterium]|nr:hypothetical protein [Bacteroidales bacterium]